MGPPLHAGGRSFIKAMPELGPLNPRPPLWGPGPMSMPSH